MRRIEENIRVQSRKQIKWYAHKPGVEQFLIKVL